MNYENYVIPTPTTKDDFIFASGNYLTEHLPHDEIDDWTHEQMIQFIDEHKWEGVEYWSAEDIYEFIVSLAIYTTHYRKQSGEKWKD